MGTVINTLLIILGSLCGLVLRKSVPSHWQETIMQGLGLVVMVIGIQMALKTNNVINVIINASIVSLPSLFENGLNEYLAIIFLF